MACSASLEPSRSLTSSGMREEEGKVNGGKGVWREGGRGAAGIKSSQKRDGILGIWGNDEYKNEKMRKGFSGKFSNVEGQRRPTELNSCG